MDSINERDDNQGLTLTPAIQDSLMAVAKWGRIISIFGFILIGMMLVVSFFFGSLLSQLSGMGGEEALGGGVMAILYVIVAIIYFFPILFLYRFSTYLLTALKDQDLVFLESSFDYLHKHYKYIGVFAIITAAFYAISFVFALVGTLFISS